jgi:hypothetical protein
MILVIHPQRKQIHETAETNIVLENPFQIMIHL